MSASQHLSTNEQGLLVLTTADGTAHSNARPARLFPLTDPDHWIAIQNAAGEELACIEDPSTLDESQRAVLRKAMAQRDFVPIIHSIDRITRAPNGHDWHVATDRGATVFRVENDESIQHLGVARMVIIDNRNTRYLIPNIAALDAKSRQRLERYY